MISYRVGCAECGDAFWDRDPGDKCPTCGERLIKFSEIALEEYDKEKADD